MIVGEKDRGRWGWCWHGWRVLDHITPKGWLKNIFRTDKKLACPAQQEKQVKSIYPGLSFTCQNISPRAPLPAVSSYQYHIWTVLRYISLTTVLPNGTADLVERQDNHCYGLSVCRKKLEYLATWCTHLTDKANLENDLMGSRGTGPSDKVLKVDHRQAHYLMWSLPLCQLDRLQNCVS